MEGGEEFVSKMLASARLITCCGNNLAFYATELHNTPV